MTARDDLWEAVADSGMTAENVARAEMLWANLPVGPRKWTSLATHEKALVCHTVARIERETREACAKVASRKLFPILGSQGAKIDWQLVADHGKQARANHYQTVEHLAERGGLAWTELYAVLHDRPWQKIDENEAIRACRQLEAAYLAAIRKEPT